MARRVRDPGRASGCRLGSRAARCLSSSGSRSCADSTTTGVEEYVVVNLGKLGRFERDTVVDPDALTEAGLIPRASSQVKVLAAGGLEHALTLRVHRISASARTAVESAGGSVELLGPQPAADDAEPVGKRAKRRAAAFVARAALLSGAITEPEPAPAPRSGKRAKGAAAETAPKATAADRKTKRAAARDQGATPPATDEEPDAAQDTEAANEETE